MEKKNSFTRQFGSVLFGFGVQHKQFFYIFLERFPTKLSLHTK